MALTRGNAAAAGRGGAGWGREPAPIAVEIGVLSLDGVDPGDPLVAGALRQALAGALGEQAPAVAGAIAGGVEQEAK
jgi:hypothetical protein